MTQNRNLSFKIEKLNSSETVVDEKSIILTSGSVDVGQGGNRRKCSFTLLEPLPGDWQGYRWKLYYGYTPDNVTDPVYYPLGIFIPINPAETEESGHLTVSYQGVDKEKIFSDYQIDSPITFSAPMDVRDIISQVAAWFNETKLNLDVNLGTIQVDRTFEEGTTADSILNTILSSFGDEWFYDVNGYLVARQTVDPNIRPISFVMDDIDSPIYISASTDVDDSNYYNTVTVVGGTVDTPIYRYTATDHDAINNAGGRVVQKYFKIDGAVTQVQVTGNAISYLSGGIQLPATLSLDSLVIPNLDIGDILVKDGFKYETKSFNIPLSTDKQTIKAGKIPLSTSDYKTQLLASAQAQLLIEQAKLAQLVSVLANVTSAKNLAQTIYNNNQNQVNLAALNSLIAQVATAQKNSDNETLVITNLQSYITSLQ